MDLGLQADPVTRLHAFLNRLDERSELPCARTAAVDDEVGVFRADLCSSYRQTLQARGFDEAPGVVALGVAKRGAARRHVGGLGSCSVLEVFLDQRAACRRVRVGQGDPRPRHHRALGYGRAAVAEVEGLGPNDAGGSVNEPKPHVHDAIRDLAEAGSRIHPYRTAGGAWDSGEHFEAGPTLTHRLAYESDQLEAAAQRELPWARRAGLGERACQSQYDAADSEIADQEVARVAQWEHGAVVLMSDAKQGGQVLFGGDLEVAVSRAPRAPPGLLGERLVLTYGEALGGKGGGNVWVQGQGTSFAAR